MLNCHCSDCRKANGSAYAALIILPRNAVKLRGEPRFHKVTGGSGKAVERGFCPSCGSQIIVRIEKLPDVLAVQAGTLDDPTLITSAASWTSCSSEKSLFRNDEFSSNHPGSVL